MLLLLPNGIVKVSPTYYKRYRCSMGLETITEPYTCAYCGTWTGPESVFTIHRDGFGDGPEVPLCTACGEETGPSCAAIWERISRHKKKPPRDWN